MLYEIRTLNYLLEEQKSKECGLVELEESSDDDNHPKYSKWIEVPDPRSHADSSAAKAVSSLAVTLSKAEPLASIVKRTAAEQEGIDRCTMSLWCQTLLRVEPNRLVSFQET